MDAFYIKLTNFDVLFDKDILKKDSYSSLYYILNF